MPSYRHQKTPDTAHTTRPEVVLGELVQTADGKWITRTADQPHGEKPITYICIEQDRRSCITTVRFGQTISP
jgi:hypothetical protein